MGQYFLDIQYTINYFRFVNETVRTGLGLNPDLEVVLDTNAKPMQEYSPVIFNFQFSWL